LDRERAKKIKGDFPAFLENWYRAPLFSSMARQPERLEELMATRAKNDTDWLAKLIVELSPGTVVSHWERLAELAMPVGLIGGRLDAKYQLTLDQMQAQIPNARRYDIADAGHNAHWEKPGDYLKIVQDCLS
jgi:2-succinyl-6-hydroxy-2,4-cyclohexadiene-1-carboxylate synthase